MTGIWAVVPVKEFEGAKQRLSSCLSPEERRALATIMLEDVLDALSAVKQLAGVLVVTVDPVARSLAGRYGARIVTEAIPVPLPPLRACLPARTRKAARTKSPSRVCRRDRSAVDAPAACRRRQCARQAPRSPATAPQD